MWAPWAAMDEVPKATPRCARVVARITRPEGVIVFSLRTGASRYRSSVSSNCATVTP